MTQEEILEGNKIIAIFSGYQYYPHPDPKGDPGWRKEKGHRKINRGYYLARTTKDLAYHCSWNWLMPVVRKIVEICIDETNDLFESEYYTSILETVPLAIIEDSYKVVVEFIKFYNEWNKQKN